MGNHEVKDVTDKVHLFLAFKRTKDNEKSSTKTLREVIKNPSKETETLEILKAKCKILGGTWRIHKTVNARDVKKALKVLQHSLIDHPEKASYIDSAWRTALLQRECIYGEPRFMFDIDTKEKIKQDEMWNLIGIQSGRIIDRIETPSGGLHLVTFPFDTREVLKLGNITLLRDGYIYICSVEEKNDGS